MTRLSRLSSGRSRQARWLMTYLTSLSQRPEWVEMCRKGPRGADVIEIGLRSATTCRRPASQEAPSVLQAGLSVESDFDQIGASARCPGDGAVPETY